MVGASLTGVSVMGTLAVAVSGNTSSSSSPAAAPTLPRPPANPMSLMLIVSTSATWFSFVSASASYTTSLSAALMAAIEPVNDALWSREPSPREKSNPSVSASVTRPPTTNRVNAMSPPSETPSTQPPDESRSTSKTEMPLSVITLSSSTIWLDGTVIVGASFVDAMLTAMVSVSWQAPPAPTLPWSLIVTVISSAPQKSWNGVYFTAASATLAAASVDTNDMYTSCVPSPLMNVRAANDMPGASERWPLPASIVITIGSSTSRNESASLTKIVSRVMDSSS
mmetsp:Transcript_8631/g.30605  ORF Transcript_8631/g.30605 Transcript_8631/m.30605 type:complete len:282 (-) Transcript_8631:179-1024(-)